MSLYEDWVSKAYNKEGQSVKNLWDEYAPIEQKAYEEVLSNKTAKITGTVTELGKKYNMSPEFVCGFLDGINEAVTPTIEISELKEEDKIAVKIDFKLLYKKMVEYKAQHLYSLPQWDEIFTQEEQKVLYYEQKKSGTVVKEEKPGRNDQCPCGSGKKYKKCCGLN